MKLLFSEELTAGAMPESDSLSTLHVGRPSVGDTCAFLQKAEKILASGRLSNDGPFVQQFEQRICGFLGVRNAVAVCNGTLGLQVAAKALGLTGEVIMPSFTFVATAHALEWIGLEPVFVDIDPETHNIDPERIDKAIKDRTSAIVGVHLWGTPCHTAAIEAIAKKRGLQVIYDASHAFGSSLAGRKIGGFGACEVFSLHATKFVHTFEGGVITTNNDELAARMRLMRNFGFQGYDRVVSCGINAKMAEIPAAMGLCSLAKMQAAADRNRRNYLLYAEHLRGLPGIALLAYNDTTQGNYQYVVVEVDRNSCPYTRDELVDVLHAQHIIARKYFWPGCHRMEPYLSAHPSAVHSLNCTEDVAEKVLILPTGEQVDQNAIVRICSILREAMS